jgi:DtxR family transcriptional regulator, Mn-dependent transcriptional regulator
MQSPVVADYLETIYNLTMEGDSVIAARLARRFKVSAPNVAAVLRRMELDGLVVRDERKGIGLTAGGRARAESVLRRHRLAERFLLEVLGLDWIVAHEQAHHLEHSFTDELEERIDAVLRHPATCPHGNPIPGGVPDASRYLQDLGAFRLTEAVEQQEVEVVCISEVVEDETALLRYAGQNGMRPGARLRLLSREPGGALSAKAGESSVVFGPDFASKIWVRAYH